MISQKVRPWLPGSNFRFGGSPLISPRHWLEQRNARISLGGAFWSFCHDLSADDCRAEREKIRQQLVDGGVAKEHADAIMCIVPYECAARPKRADVGETHKYPHHKRKVAVPSKENDKKTRTRVDDHSALLRKLQQSEEVSNNEVIELLKAQQSKQPGPSHKKKEKESGEEDSEMADGSGGANEGGEPRAQAATSVTIPLTLDAMKKVFTRSMGPSSNCHECGCVITDEAMRNVGTLPMTTRCLDCHKKQGNVAAATTICYSTSAPSPVTWVKGKPIELKPTMCKCGTSVAHDAPMTTTLATCTVVHMLPFLRQQDLKVLSCTCSNQDCKETVLATLEDAGGAGLLWFGGSLDKQDPLMLDLNSGKKQWFVSMPDIAHLNEVRMLTKCALKKWVEACYETAVHFGWSDAEMLSDETISNLLMALLVYGKLKIDVRQKFALPDRGPTSARASLAAVSATASPWTAATSPVSRRRSGITLPLSSTTWSVSGRRFFSPTRRWKARLPRALSAPAPPSLRTRPRPSPGSHRRTVATSRRPRRRSRHRRCTPTSMPTRGVLPTRGRCAQTARSTHAALGRTTRSPCSPRACI